MNLYDQIGSNKRRSFIIMFVFVAVIAGLGLVFGLAYDAGYSLFIPAMIFALASAGFSYYFGDSVALAMGGAKQIDKASEPRLYRTVENLCIGAGILPIPKIYIIEDAALNAFATGRDPKHSSIAVTRGLLNRLEDLELEGVVAHELSHIKNFDIRTMAIAVVLVGVVALVSEWFLRITWSSNRSNDRNSSNGVFLILAIIGAILAPLLAQLLKFALSREREFLADASGALLTRYPEGLARALEKISADHTPLQHANTATAHMYIENPLEDRRGSKIAMLFSTHPDVTERIRRLRAM